MTLGLDNRKESGAGWTKAGTGRTIGTCRAAALLSPLIVLPCYWLPRIQAGDLSSHIYNAWLVQLIEGGQVEGLFLARQTTNLLFDLLLGGLFVLFGAGAAQRIAVTLAVLVFVWGAFAFVSAATRRPPWSLLPVIAILAYGWVFHMGFFNYYLSLGLCFWALAAAWKGGKPRLMRAGVLLGLAYVAHALPLAWAMALLGYMWAARRVAPRRRVALTAAVICGMAALHWFLTSNFPNRWSMRQIWVATAADQAWVFGSKYFVVLLGLLLIWSFLFLNLIHLRGARRLVLGVPFQLCVLSAALVATLPSAILLPGYGHALTFITDRMSLVVGICLCVLFGAARPKLWQGAAIAAVAAVFFCFLYVDERALNLFEDRVHGAVAQLPPGARVVSSITEPSSRVNALAHVIDRACIGRCFSYANYEASTRQFRVRARGRNPWVVATYFESKAVESGTYVPRDSDLPLYQVDLDGAGGLMLKELKAGSPCGRTALNIFPVLGSAHAFGMPVEAGSPRKPGAF